MKTKGISVALLASPLLVGPATVLAGSPAARRPREPVAAAPIIYAPDFVSAVAYGVAINDAGDMVGTSYTDPGCGPFCLPPLETVVWKAGVRIVLPSVPGLTGTAVTSINNHGWISGFAGSFGFSHAVVWKPKLNTYTAIDLGCCQEPTGSPAASGIDDTKRVVGYSHASNLLPDWPVYVDQVERHGRPNQAGVPKRDPAWDQFRRDCGHVRLLVSLR